MNNLDNNIISILQQRYQNQPERILYRFLTYQDSLCSMEDHTIKDIYETSLRMACTLKSKGLKKGDRAVIFSMQDFGTICAVLGCMMTGVVFTIIPPPLDDGKIERFIAVLKSCRPKALISNYELEKTSNVNITSRLIREAFLQVIGLKRIYTDKLLSYIKPDVITRVYPEDLVYLQYTSGSTSSPKGVRVTQKALMKNMEQCKHVYNFDYSTLGTWVPYFHNLGLVITIFMPICTEHATIYNLQTLQFLENPKLWIKMLSDYKLTLTVGPGSAYDACTKIFTPEEAAQYDLSHMTHLMNGSEYVSPKTIADFSKLFHVQPHAFAPGYGLAENVCLASVASLDYRVINLDYEKFQNNKIVPANEEDPNPKQIVGLGAAVKDLTMIACNPKTCRAYKDLRIGEIFISGDSVADGYWDNPKETRKFHYKIEGYDGDFYKTGDLGFLKDGYLYLTGRIKEMLIVNGHNVYPSDLLLLIQQKIPALAMSAIGFFSYNDGQKEQVVACIESRSDLPFDERVSQINALVSERFGFSFHDVVFVPLKSLPRTDNSKLQMLKARKLYLDGKLSVIYSSHQKRTAKLPGEQTLIDRSKEVADEILLQVKSVFDKVLNIDHYSLNQSFLELGGDSLTGFELVSKMEQKFKIKLDLRELLLDSSVSGVASYVRRMLSGAKGSGRTVNLAQECTLDSHLRPRQDYNCSLSECRHIFLTGATGFLGAHLIQSFIRQYPHDNLMITCLVRAESEEEGKERIIRNMKHFHCWDTSYEQYICAVTGDLSSPNLGIDNETYAKLAAETDAIYHNGAVLNFVFPYEFLKSTNVNGTIETLRLACTGPAKYYHYISSYSVYDTPDKTGKRVYENDPLTTSKGFSLAYSETKWVSEKLVGIAKKRGLHTVIYRPGDITGTRRGIWEVDDMVSRVIAGSIQMRCIPRSTYCMHMTPVDYVADAITCISRKPEALGEAFNIINPKPVSMKQLISDIRQCGYPIRYIPFPVWRKRLRTADAEENSLAILECLFEAGTDANPGILRHFIGKDTTYDVSKTELLLNGTDITCPKIDTEMIASYLRYFKKLGRI